MTVGMAIVTTTVLILVVFIVFAAAYSRQRDPKRFVLPDEDAIEVPALEVLLVDPNALDALRRQITLIGFLHRNGQGDANARRFFSEIYVVRIDGIPQTIHSRSRSIEHYNDEEGETLARMLASKLGLDLQVG